LTFVSKIFSVSSRIDSISNDKMINATDRMRNEFIRTEIRKDVSKLFESLDTNQ